MITGRRTVAAAVIAAAAIFGCAARAADVSGAWALERYDGGGSLGPSTGHLLLVDGRFSLIYTMRSPDGTLSGRAHGGTYRLDGDMLRLQVDWSLDHVRGRGGVAQAPSTRSPRIAVEGDRLTLSYGNGGVMAFRRVTQGRTAR